MNATKRQGFSPNTMGVQFAPKRRVAFDALDISQFIADFENMNYEM
jgi:hypothetical protein